MQLPIVSIGLTACINLPFFVFSFSTEADLVGIKTLQAMCSITLDTCSQWFPNETN